jgi:hypothetical protein
MPAARFDIGRAINSIKLTRLSRSVMGKWVIFNVDRG